MTLGSGSLQARGKVCIRVSERKAHEISEECAHTAFKNYGLVSPHCFKTNDTCYRKHYEISRERYFVPAAFLSVKLRKLLI